MKPNNRYCKQILVDQIGEDGQEKLADSRVAIVGCGALGTIIANNLARSGVGHVKIVDRDIVELSNLQRQMLFDEEDIGLPKATVAGKKLRKVNSESTIESVVEDVNSQNIVDVIKNMDVVLDGTDNMVTRFLLNDICIKLGIPWIYGGAIGTCGMTMTVIPYQTPCFRCVIKEIPDAGALPTCDTVGVLNTIPAIIASIESTEAIKIILGHKINQYLLFYNVWTHDFQPIKIMKRKGCECCEKHNFEFLNEIRKESFMPLCGSNAIQITPVKSMEISFEELGKRLNKIGDVTIDEIILKFSIPGYEFNVFRNGRTIIYGTNKEELAKSLYSKYIGA